MHIQLIQKITPQLPTMKSFLMKTHPSCPSQTPPPFTNSASQSTIPDTQVSSHTHRSSPQLLPSPQSRLHLIIRPNRLLITRRHRPRLLTPPLLGPLPPRPDPHTLARSAIAAMPLFLAGPGSALRDGVVGDVAVFAAVLRDLVVSGVGFGVARDDVPGVEEARDEA